MTDALRQPEEAPDDEDHFVSTTTSSDDGSSARRWADRHQPALAWFLCAVAPIVVFFGYQIEPFYLQNGVDPFIYSGYIFNMNDMVERYGYTYFSVRFGLLLPSEFFDQLLGPTAGYYALRWLLVSGVLAVLYIWCRRLGHPVLGLIAGALFMINPIVIRSVTTVYSDAVGVPYVAAAFGLLLLPGSRKNRLVATGLAGVLIGLTVHANLFMAVPLGAALAVWLVVRAMHYRRDVIFEVIAISGAIAAVTAIGAAVYLVRFGKADILTPSIDTARRLQNTATADRAPNRQWVDFRPYLWLPFVAVVVLGITLAIRRVRPAWFEVAAAGMLVAASIVYVYQEFIQEGYLMETYFYTSYFIGPTILVVLLAIRRMLEGLTRPMWLIGPALVTVVIYPFVWKHAVSAMRVWALPTVPIVILVVAALIMVGRRWERLNGGAASLLVICPLLFTLSAPHDVPLAAGQAYRREPIYESAMFNHDHKWFDYYDLAQAFSEFVPDWNAEPGSVIFWYSDDDVPANLMGSTFLWRFNTITVTPPGLPALDATEIAQLTARTPRFLVIVASSEDRVTAGADAIRAAVDPIRTEVRTFSSNGLTMSAELMEFVPSACDATTKGQEYLWIAYPPCP